MISRLFDLFLPERTAAEPAPEERVQLATSAILVEAARADREFTPEERSHIIRTLHERFSLSKEDAEELVAESKKSLNESSDLWRFTNVLNQHCTPEEKREIVEEAWRVIFMDGALHAHEDHLLHKLGTLLNLTHPQLMDAKLKVLAEIRGESTA